jgi:Glycosyltransferase 61
MEHVTEGIQQVDAIEELTARGVAARQNGDRVGALALFEAAIDRDPVNAGAAHREAVAVLLGLGLTSLAEDALDLALSVGADFPRADLQRGRLAAERGDAELALRCFTKTIADSPRAAWPYALAAKQLRTLGRYGEALEVVGRGLERCGGLEAGNPDLLEERALGLLGLGLIDEARESISGVLAFRKNVAHLWKVGFFLASREQFAEALELLEGLEAEAREHVIDLISYTRCIKAIRGGQSAFEELRVRADQDRTAERLEVRPYVFGRDVSLDEIRSLAAVEQPTKCYLIDDPSATCPAPEPAPALARLVEKDLALVRWKPGQGFRQVCFQYLLPDCFVDSTHAAVSRSGRFVPELVPVVNPLTVMGTALREPAALGPIDQVFLTPFLSWRNVWNNYFHLVVDILSSLAIYERLGLRCPIVVPGPVDAVHAELIRASGVPEETPVLPVSDVRGRLLRLAVCAGPVSAQLLREWCASVVRRTVGDSEGEVGDEILYISRAKSANRPLVNEEQLIEMLRGGWNCRVAHMEDLSHAEQVGLVRRARIVVGPHGAGLTNMLFARRHTPLIELLPSRYPYPAYAKLAGVSGRLYLPIVGKTEKTNVASERDMRWRVDLDKVATVLDAALYATRHSVRADSASATER